MTAKIINFWWKRKMSYFSRDTLRIAAGVVGTALAGAATYGLTRSRENKGRDLKRLGKTIGNQRMIDKGREMQYGHMRPDELLQHHPSAFLRQYEVRSFLEGADAPATQATDHNHQFALINIGAGGYDITESRTGVSKKAKQQLGLIHAANLGDNEQVGHTFNAAFLPMRQANPGEVATGNIDNVTVANGVNGRVTDVGLTAAHTNMTMTTQLSGCSVTRQQNALSHIRPHASGTVLNTNLGTQHTFGRQDMPHGEAFVMMRKKPDGRTKLHWQRDSQQTTTGKKYL